MRKGSVLQLIAIGVLLGAIAGIVAYFVPFLPTQASRERGRIDFVFWLVTVISIAVFSLVGAVILYSVVKFRARPDDDTDGPPIHGNTRLEVVWTAVPALLVTAIAIASGIVLSRNSHVPADHLSVKVTARQFAWSFSYQSAANLTAGQLRLPLGKPVELNLTSDDVIHSFWVPQFGQKQDALPGSITHVVITPTKLGTYPVVCTELCGLGHSLMRTSAIVMRPAAFQAWLRGQQKVLGGGGGAAGKSVYANNGCAACHTLAAAGSTATIGPSLDKLPQEAARAGKPLQDFVRESIVDPNAYIEPGFSPNIMPQTFASLPKQQLDALVQFLVSSSKK